MSEHTKGPWSVDPKKQLRVCNKDDMTVASCGTSGPIREQWEANARLIAAAPELLEALRWALPLARIAQEAHRLERLRYGHSDIGAGRERNKTETLIGLWDEEVEAMDRAVAVIAKATGSATHTAIGNSEKIGKVG